MKYNEIKDVVESRFEKINESWDKTIKHFNMEDIHDFRVQIKKIRAFIRLASIRLPGPVELKLPYQLKSLYWYAGVIRNLQLQEQRIFEFIQEKEINQPHQYLKILLNHEDRSKQNIHDIYNHRALETEEEMIIRTLEIKLGKATMKKYAQTKAGQLKTLMAFGEHSDEELHQIRKILKDVLYTLSYTGDDFFSFFNGGLQTQEEIESLTDLLGEFQDACMCLQLLLPDYTKELNDPAEIRLLETIREEWASKKLNVRSTICNNLEQLHPTISVPEST